FLPLFKETIRSPAWRAMSHGADALYIALKWRHVKINGHVYLSQRDAEAELGSNRNYIGRGFRKRAFFGFVQQTSPGGLGVDGRGKAPHYRLTELPCMGEPATKD